MGTVLTDNFIAEQIKSRLNSGDACCHSVKNLLSSSLLSKNVKIKIYRTVISPVVYMSVNLCLDCAGSFLGYDAMLIGK